MISDANEPLEEWRPIPGYDGYEASSAEAGQPRERGHHQRQRARLGNGGSRCKHRDAARIRLRRRAGVHPVGASGAGERHENIAVERIYRDRMRTRGSRQVDHLGNHGRQAAVGDDVEEPSVVGVAPAGYANARFAIAQNAQDSNRGVDAAGNLVNVG